MPFIHLSIADKLTDEQKEAIISKFGQLIEILPGKTEKALMIRLDDNQQMYFRGVQEKCAYIDIRLYMMQSFEKKSELTKAVIAYISELLEMDPANIYMTYSEYNNWGSNGAFK